MIWDAATVGRDLAELNAGFLELVAGGADARLPESVLAGLRAMEARRRHRLGVLPFALFGFGFEEEGFWSGLLSPGVRELEPGYPSPEPRTERFTLVVLTALRGLARVAPHATSAWIGLPEATRRRLAQLEIGLLAPVAVHAAPRLRGRLSLREPVWLRLIEAAERDDAEQLRLLAALGSQWTIRRSLGIGPPRARPRSLRR
jgi:hypothetical protein